MTKHHRAHFGCAGRLRITSTDHFTKPQDGCIGAQGLDFIELVGDENDAFAFILERLNGAEQLFRFNRGKNAGWLVQNDDIWIGQHCSDNFNPLLFTRR